MCVARFFSENCRRCRCLTLADTQSASAEGGLRRGICRFRALGTNARRKWLGPPAWRYSCERACLARPAMVPLWGAATAFAPIGGGARARRSRWNRHAGGIGFVRHCVEPVRRHRGGRVTVRVRCVKLSLALAYTASRIESLCTHGWCVRLSAAAEPDGPVFSTRRALSRGVVGLGLSIGVGGQFEFGWSDGCRFATESLVPG